MTLQQLRYLVAVAEYGSFNAAASRLYASQSNLSTSVKELEDELGVQVFTRSKRGVGITNEGTEVLAYARLVVEQADLFESRFKEKQAAHKRLAISAQHYAFSVKAFIDVVEECADDEYEFIMRECSTAQIIDDVNGFRSDVGILYMDRFNRRVMAKVLRDADLSFTPLFTADIHVFVGENHPLASRSKVFPAELQSYPRYNFEQGTANSLYYSEEPLGQLPCKQNIRISDRGTLTNLLTSHNGYTLSTGVLSDEMQSGIASIPLATEDRMQVGYVMHAERNPSDLLLRYLDRLKTAVAADDTVDLA